VVGIKLRPALAVAADHLGLDEQHSTVPAAAAAMNPPLKVVESMAGLSIVQTGTLQQQPASRILDLAMWHAFKCW
jgi:hypothetical protein